jgi:hypothetical protein
MAENAWLNFYCETDKQVRVATFRLVGKEWHLIEVSADPLPEGGAIPGRIPMTGPFGDSSDYTGCPGCGAETYVRCGACGEVGCWHRASVTHTCAKCGNHATVEGVIESIDAMDVA